MVINEAILSNIENSPFSSVVATLQVTKICPLCWAATLPTIILLSYNCTLVFRNIQSKVIVFLVPGMYKLNTVTILKLLATF